MSSSSEAGYAGDGAPWWRVKINGVDIYRPGAGQVRSHGADGTACRFVDTDCNEASFSSARPTFRAPAMPPTGL